MLNFGHTFAHAYEASLNFSKKLNHGEAVILGINTALSFSYKNKFLGFKEYNLIRKHIYNSKLPFNLKKYFSLKDLNKILNLEGWGDLSVSNLKYSIDKSKKVCILLNNKKIVSSILYVSSIFLKINCKKSLRVEEL